MLGFLVEMRYGIPRGKLPRNPASTRHNLLMNQIDKGQNVKSLVYKTRKEDEKSCTHAMSFSHKQMVVACGSQLCFAKASGALPSDASVTLKR